LILRFAKESDLDALLRIGNDFYQHNVYKEHVDLDPDSLAATISMLRAEHVLLVAEIDGKVVGAAGAIVAPLYWNHAKKQGIEIFWWLDPEHRGGGKGKLLRQMLQDVAKMRGADFWNMIALESLEPEKVGAMYTKDGLQLVEHIYMKAL
jgi:L-amino acid N-acyltransferase YncA